MHAQGVHADCKSHDLARDMYTTECRLPANDTYQYLSVSCFYAAAGMHGIQEDWTVDLLACTYHAGKFAIWGAVEGIIIAICILGIREAAAHVQKRAAIVLQQRLHASTACACNA